VDRHIREGRAQKVAIRCGESVYTYGDLAADINRAGNGIQDSVSSLADFRVLDYFRIADHPTVAGIFR
jgi:hypothetical protein